MQKYVENKVVKVSQLKAEPLHKSSGWSLAKEDPLVYTREDREGYCPPRQWPDEPYPTPPADAPAPPAMDPKIVAHCMAEHHINTDLLRSINKDPCKEYADRQVSNVLEAIMPKDKKCPVCGEEVFNTQRLRSHIRAKHMDHTPFHCAICNKFFGDQSQLTLHNKKHDPAAPQFTCTTCQKVYYVRSRLTEHMKSHLQQNINQPCQYCGKVIKAVKNLKGHEKICSQNPTKAPRKQCPYCPKNYDQKKDLLKHAREHHPGRDFQRDYV